MANFKTIFDYGVTIDEYQAIRGGLDKEKYLTVVDEQTALSDIAYLLHNRGNNKDAIAIAKELPGSMQECFLRTIEHP